MKNNIRFQLVLLVLLLGSSAQAVTLQESLRLAFENNPRTQANDLRLKAMEVRTKAAWQAFLPQIYASYGLSRDRYSSANGGQVPVSSSSLSRGLNLALSVNIYDGGATYYRAKATEVSQKAQAASYNSTNALIPNTRGSIASLVFTAYSGLLRSQAEKEFLVDLRKSLQVILKAATTEDEVNIIQSGISALEISISNAEFQIESEARDYEYVVQSPAPNEMESYQEAIANVDIPATAAQAFTVALKKSPELQVAAYQLEAMELNYRAEKAAVYSPRIDLGISHSRSSVKSGQDPFNRNRGTAIGITAQWSFGVSAMTQAKATALEVEAARKDKEGTLEELKYNLDSIYPTLKNTTHLSQLFDQRLNESVRNLKSFLERVEQGEKGNISYALQLLENVENSWYQATAMKQSVLATKFSIQKTIGTLFEKVEEAKGLK